MAFGRRNSVHHKAGTTVEHHEIHHKVTHHAAKAAPKRKRTHRTHKYEY